MDRLLITGAEGMVASHFVALYGDRYDVLLLSRRPIGENTYHWDPMAGELDLAALEGVDHILHLSGAPISRHRWTTRYKDEILMSRAGATALIASTLMNNDLRIKTFISASAVGYYGVEEQLSLKYENSPAGTDFVSHVCKAWEEEANFLYTEGLADRVVVARMGMVLAHYGGVLPRIDLAAKSGWVPVLGSGEQPFPWIHINDLCRIFRFMLDHKGMRGVYNAVAPDLVSYREMAQALAAAHGSSLHELWVPSSLVRKVYSEASDVVLKGVNVSSEKLLRAGYEFLYPRIEEALDHIYQP